MRTSTEIGFETEMSAFGLNFCHGLGLGLHERPLVSRLNSLKDPIELKAGMVFAVETYCPAKDGISAARIEEAPLLSFVVAAFGDASAGHTLTAGWKGGNL